MQLRLPALLLPLIVVLLGARGASAAEPACVPVEPDFLARAAASGRDYLRKDAILAFEALWAEVQAAVPCLTGPVPTDALASLVLDAAIVEDARGRPPQDLLEAVAQMSPTVLAERGSRTGRPALKDAPVGSRGPAFAAPKGAEGRLWLDGAALPATFHLDGVHVVQLVVDGAWTSAWVADGVPPDWWRGAARGRKGAPRPLKRPRRRRRRALAALVVGTLLSGCRVLHVEARALADVNDGQPVALHVHQLARIPAGLPALGCAELRPGPEPPSFAADRLGDASIVSALPGQRTTVSVSRFAAARWALVAPEWSECADADGWALVPLGLARRRLRIELTGREIQLPWDRATPPDGGKRWKQPGYVDGQPSHVVVRAPRAMR